LQASANSVPPTIRLKAASKCCSVISPSLAASPLPALSPEVIAFCWPAGLLLFCGTARELRAHIASGSERNKGWLRAVFDPQMGTALSAIHNRVNTPWTVESLAEAAGMSRSAFAARFKELLGQTPLGYVTEWRMQKAMQLLEPRDKKLIDVARSVGYESDAAFSKAFKRVVGASPGEYSKRDFGDRGHVGMAVDY
jgi:AraC-like DNA-binding protein